MLWSFLGYAYFSNKGKIGFINKIGKVIIKPTGYGAGYFSEGLAVWAKDSEKYGYINTKGKTVIPLKYESAYDFSEGLPVYRKKENMDLLIRRVKWLSQPYMMRHGDFQMNYVM